MPKLVRAAYSQPLEVSIDLDSGEVVEVLVWGAPELDERLGRNVVRYDDDKPANDEDTKAAIKVAETTIWPAWNF